MTTLADEMRFDALFSMFKGEPGTRKSTSALSYPTPQYWFNHDKKMKALLLPMKNWGINPLLIESDSYEDWDKPRQKLEALRLNCKYKTLVVDTITSLADGTLRQGKIMKGLAGTVKRVNNIPVNSVEDYGAEDSALSEMLALCKDIHEHHKVNIILIAHVMVAEYRNEVTKETHVSRTIVTAGKRISLKIPAYCDEVYHFNVEKSMAVNMPSDYTMLTQHTGDDFARTVLPLDRVVKFNDKPLYGSFILPTIERFRNDLIPKTSNPPTVITQHNPLTK